MIVIGYCQCIILALWESYYGKFLCAKCTFQFFLVLHLWISLNL